MPLSQEDDPGETYRDEHPILGPTVPREKAMEPAFPGYRNRGSELASRTTGGPDSPIGPAGFY